MGYRRDALAGPLRELSSVVASVRSQKFFPDTRGGRSLRLPLLPHLQAVLRSRALGRLRDDTSSSSDSSAVSADSDDADEQLVASAPHFVENLRVVGGFATNRKSGLLHVVRQAAGRFLCGRLLGQGFEVSESLDAGAKKFCRTCKTCALAAA